MKYFVFRNMTIERMFSNLEVEFSNYEDISYIPYADRYVWFYISPVNPNTKKKASSIMDYVDMLNLTIQRIESKRMVIAFTMRDLYSVNSVISDRTIEEAITAYNSALIELTQRYSNLKIVDFSSFTNKYAERDLIDWKYFFISQMAINPRLTNQFQCWFAERINSIELKRKKCLILDMDNTLWGGVLGEDGIDGIKLGGDYPGKAFLMFQKQLKELSHQGVMLAVCSKNNLSDVKEMWTKHPDCVLKEDVFVISKINWQNKADNIRQMADELNIGLDSMVFVDDNPAERALIEKEIPEIVVPVFPEQPYMIPLFISEIAEHFFSIYSLTNEDILKTAQYKANALRNRSKVEYTNMEDYIRSLEIVLSIEEANEITIPRIAQMTQKINQFNLTTKRYSDTDIAGFVSRGDKIYTVSVSDKFGDNGITGTCIIKMDGKEAFFDSMLLSCRILGKNIEFTFVSYILSILKTDGILVVTAQYRPTSKNVQVAEFYEKCGFELIGMDNAGTKLYKINLSEKDIKISNVFNIL